MAYTASAVMECRASGSSNLNSGVFDSGVANPGTDYTLQDASQANGTNLVSANGTNATPSVTSVTYTFTTADEGNSIVISSGTNWTVSVFIITDTSAGAAILDKACGSTDILASGTWRMGGAYPMGNTTSGISDDTRFELLQAGNRVWVKSGTYTQGITVSVGTSAGTSTNPIIVEGYASTRGDAPNPFGASPTAPVVNLGSLSFGVGAFYEVKHISFTTTSSNGVNASPTTTAAARFYKCKSLNTSTLAPRNAFLLSSSSTVFNQVTMCEAISQNGYGIYTQAGRGHQMYGNYAHDSGSGIVSAGAVTPVTMAFNLVTNNTTAAIEIASGICRLYNNTLYGSEAKLGTGVSIAAALGPTLLFNNIIYGFVTGVSQATAQERTNAGAYNDFYNNTDDATNYTLDATDLTVDPQFTAATQITGTTATTSGSVLTQSGGDFSTVTDNIDFLHVVSGTGVTVGNYLITGHTGTTLTVNNALGTSSGGDVVYFVPTGHNYSVGTNLKAAGFPGAFPGSDTTGYLDIGAVQRQESSSGGTRAYVG